MAGNIKGIIVEIGGDTSGLQNALKKVNSATSGLSKELRGVNSLLKLDPSSTELLAQKQTLLSKNIEETSEKLKLLKDIQKQADDAIANGTEISEENYRALQREIVNTENKLKTLQTQSSKWTTAGKAIEEFGNKIVNVSDKADKLGNTLTTSLTVPIVGVGAAAVSTGNNFEAQMSRVQAIAGATKEELEQLTNQAIDLGAKTSFSATEVAEGMENLASAGFTTEEIMSAMPGLLDLAASSGAELATASEIAASAIRGFGLEADKSTHIADVFAEAAARTNAQTEDMGEAMKYVAPVAKTVGLSIEETAAAIGIMSDAGIKGSQAGTTLRSGLVRIVKPTKQVKTAMEELGVEFYDNDGKMKSLKQIIDDLQKSTKGLSDETKNQALAQIFGTEALSGMLALVNRGADDLENMTKSFEQADGAASEMAETMLDNTAGSLESLSGSVESAGIAIQKALSPEIKKLAETIQDLVDEFTNLSEEEQLNIIKTLALVAGIGPLIKILRVTGKTLGTTIKGIGLFSQAIDVARGKTVSDVTAVNNLAKVFTALKSPVGLATLAIAGTVIAFQNATKATRENTEASQKSLETTIEEKKAIDELKASIDSEAQAKLYEIDRSKSLWEELKKITDENGKIKKSYEDRAKVIAKELSESLGIEIDITDNVIDKYKELQKEIDKLILKKKAEIILNANQEKYEEAIKNRTQKTQELLDKQEELNKAKEEETRLQKEYSDKANNWLTSSIFQTTVAKKNWENQSQTVSNLNNEISQLQSVVNGYTQDMQNYDYNLQLYNKGTEASLTELSNSVTQTYTKNGETVKTTLNRQIQEQQLYLQNATELNKKAVEEHNKSETKKTKSTIDESNKRLNDLIKELISQTSITSENSPDVINAWKSLAANSYTKYSEQLNKMDPKMRKKIEEITGVIAGDKTVKDAAEDLAKDAEEGFNNNVNGTEWGLDLTKSIASAMTSSKSKLVVSGAAATVAGWISDYIHHTTPDKGPLKDDDKWMYDFIENLTQGIYKNKNRVLNAAESLSQDLREKLMLNSDINMSTLSSAQGNVISKTLDSTRTIYTTPQIVFNVQELDEAKLQQCFNYINRKFGSQY